MHDPIPVAMFRLSNSVDRVVRNMVESRDLHAVGAVATVNGVHVDLSVHVVLIPQQHVAQFTAAVNAFMDTLRINNG